MGIEEKIPLKRDDHVEKTYHSFNEGSCPVPENGVALNVCDSEMEGITYSWSHIEVSVEEDGRSQGPKRWLDWIRKVKNCKTGDSEASKPTRKFLLSDVSGVVRPGELLAMMGASGAGKTTLLNALTFRNITGKMRVSGQRTVNGVTVGPSTLISNSGYVQQDDLFIGTLTVREQLTFQALVRMDTDIPRKRRMQRVEEVIAELGLSKCADTLIGVSGRVKGISGGEKKRLAFGCEVLTNPGLLFCDEPTSGLDSFMAQNVVQVLRAMAQKGKSILATIHQPSSEVYALFDRILLLAEGRVAFMGSPQQAINFFAQRGLPCPQNYNPADFFVHSMAIKPGEVQASKERVDAICRAFAESEDGRALAQMTQLKENGVASKDDNQNGADGAKGWDVSSCTSPYKASWCAQFRAVLWRSWVSLCKEPMVIRVRFFQTVVVSLLLGLIYFGQVMNQEGVMNINGALFLFLTNMTFQNVFSVVNVFCAELPIFLREHSNGMYRTDVYFLSKTLAELPIYIFLPVVFTSLSYYMVGFNPAPERFLICVGIVVLVCNAATSFGYMISCMSSTITVALSLGPPLIIPLMLFGGFFLNKASVPVYFVWLRYLSWFLYANEALNINQWQGVDYIECGRSNSSCTPNGKIVLQTLNFAPDNFYLDIFALLILITAFRVLAFLALLARSYQRK